MLRIALIDDEPRVRRALDFAFAGQDVEVLPIEPFAQAAEILRRDLPDAILLDISLGAAGSPGAMSGLDVCASIKAAPDLRTLPLLLLSGQTDPATKAAGLAAGADDFVAKPFVPVELLARVRAQVERYRAG
ncbi:MAG: response regulator [Chloroflexota bacterium]